MRRELRKPGLLLLAVVWLVVACGSPRQAAGGGEHTHDGHDHGVTTVVGDVLPDADLAELGRASDLVVAGRVVAAVDGIQIGSDASADHTVLTVAVDEVVKGDAGTKDAGTKDAGTKDAGTKDAGTKDAGTKDAGTKDAGTKDAGTKDAGTRAVEVAMLSRVQGVPVVIEGRPTPKVGDRGIWMLQPIAPEFGREGYVLTNQNSQILADEHGLTGGVESSPSAREVKRLGDLGRVLEHLRAAAA
jgi:hypothetical protein